MAYGKSCGTEGSGLGWAFGDWMCDVPSIP
jgi:hypothetical protein